MEKTVSLTVTRPGNSPGASCREPRLPSDCRHLHAQMPRDEESEPLQEDDVREEAVMGLFERVMLGIILLGVLVVLTQMAIRDWNYSWVNCDAATILSKHEYCVNSTIRMLNPHG